MALSRSFVHFMYNIKTVSLCQGDGKSDPYFEIGFHYVWGIWEEEEEPRICSRILAWTTEKMSCHQLILRAGEGWSVVLSGAHYFGGALLNIQDERSGKSWIKKRGGITLGEEFGWGKIIQRAVGKQRRCSSMGSMVSIIEIGLKRSQPRSTRSNWKVGNWEIPEIWVSWEPSSPRSRHGL